MNDVILKCLRDRGFKDVSTDYYKHIEKWERFWRNEVDFHKYHDQSGTERKMYSLGMAKRISEDWSSVLFSERDEINSNCSTKQQTENNNEYLGKQLKLLKVQDDLSTAIERAMAIGTEAAVVRVKQAKVDSKGNLIATKRTKMDIIYIGANQIIPLKVEHGNIIDVAFVSEDVIGNKKEFYVEIHKLEYDSELEKDVYRISNIYLDELGNEIDKDGVVKNYTVYSDIPLFSIMKPAIANPIDARYNMINGLGFSVYGTATDQLKACDIAFNNFVMDFYLGGKKVFYNKKITKTKNVVITDNEGNKKEITKEIYPDDIVKQQWTTYGDEQINLQKDPAITEYNPKLRISENKEGIQFALNMLSFKCGFGTKYYEFNGASVVTATQYVGDRQDLVENANKHRKNVDSFVSGICKAILLIGRVVFKKQVTEDCICNIADKDGFMVDTETAKQEFRLDIAQGIRQPWEYRVRFFGESEEVAKARIADRGMTDINLENNVKTRANSKQKK